MEINNAQINPVVLEAASTQAQSATQTNRSTSAPVQQQPSAEVTLSRDARERADRPQSAPQQPVAATSVSNNPVSAPDQAQSTREESGEDVTARTRENEAREQQSNVAVQAQATAPTYTARLATQSYTAVSNF